MKVVYVIDSVSEIQSKINLLKNRFGNDVLFVVKSNLIKIFETYGYKANAIYGKNLPKVIHSLLIKDEIDDVVYCKSSLEINDKILNKFLNAIKDKSKVINVIPKYNIFENMSNAAYNLYVKSLFKTKDSMASPKLQFLPKAFVEELMYSHFGNKLFEVNEKLCVNITFEDKKINENLKAKAGLNRNMLIPLIAALVITALFILSVAIFKQINFIMVLIFIFLYTLDIFFAIIYQCKLYFDERIFK